MVLITCICSCKEEIDLTIGNSTPRLVVEGLITNLPGPYYVRLTLSKPGLSVNATATEFGNDNYIPVTNATVIISDNIGNIDTLKPAPTQYYYQHIYDSHGNVIDSIVQEYAVQTNIERGYYQTKNIQGIAGRNYYLKIITGDNKIYTAVCLMPVVPKIDSISYLIKDLEIKKIKQLVPLIYFGKPNNNENYYLFQMSDPSNIPISTPVNQIWQFSIIDDRFLPDYVLGLNVEAGISPNGFEYYIYSNLDTTGNNGVVVNISMSALTKDAYYFYKSLIEQFNNDGGAYKPTPASPVGNISGNALGFFRASSVSGITKTFYVDMKK